MARHLRTLGQSLVIPGTESILFTAIARRFIEFSPVMSSRIELDVDLQDGDVIDFWYLAPRDTVAFRYLFDGTQDGGTTRLFALMGTNGSWAFGGLTGITIDGTAAVGNPYPVDGRFHRFSGTVSGAHKLQRFASRFNDQDFYPGIIYNATVTRSAAVVYDWGLGDTLVNSEYIANSAAPLGSELWTYGVVQPDGSAAALGILAGDAGGAVPANTPAFLVRMSWVNLTGRLRLLLSTSTEVNSGAKTADTGFVEFVVDSATNTRLQLQDQVGGTTADSVTITVKEAPGAGKAVGLGVGDSMLYTQVDAGATWQQDANHWTAGDAISDGTEGTFVNILTNTDLPSTGEYRWSATVEGLTAGQIQLRLGQTTALTTTSNGDFNDDAIVTSESDLRSRVRVGDAQTNSGAAMRGIEIHRILRIAQ